MRFLTEFDVFDIALTDEIRIVKRWVYSRPAVESVGPSGHQTMRVMRGKDRRRRNFRFIGRLSNGVSSKAAWGEASEAYGK